MGVFTKEARDNAIATRQRNAALRAKGLLPVNTKHNGAKGKAADPQQASLFTPAPAPTGVTPAYEIINPAKAEKWLNSNKGNRKLRAGIVEKYAKDMRDGKWTTCTAPIVFYEDGDIADGQHRLWAIIESNCAQRFLIVHGLEREAGLNIDMGFSRSLVDNADISGADHDLSTTMISLCRGIEQGDRATRYLTNSEKLAFVARHREAAMFVRKHGSQGRMFNNSIINGAIARAWYCEEDKERLKHFGQVLSKGFADGDQDTAAIALRNYILTRTRTVTGTDWRDTFLKVQNNIWHFMRRKRLMFIKSISEERYPLKGVKNHGNK